MKAIITNIEQQLTLLKQEADKLFNEITAYEVTVSNRDKTIADLKAEIAALEKQLVDLKPVEPPTPTPAIKLFYLLNGVKTELRTGFNLESKPTAIIAEPSIDGPCLFTLSGTETLTRNESVAPYALHGDSNGVFTLWTPKAGSYDLSVTSGTITVSIKFNVEAEPVTQPEPVGELFFHGKMENATIANGTLEGWRAPMEALDICRDLYLSSSTKAPAVLETFEGKRCLKASLSTPLSGARVQLGVVFTENKSLDVYHFSQEIWLHPDLEHMKQYSGAIGGTPWFVLLETWMSRVPEWPGDPVSRINIGIKKSSGAGQPLQWELRNQYIQPSSKAYTNILPAQVSNLPIPFGKWFTLEIIIKTGEGDKGRFTAKIDNDILFDVIGTTTYPGRPEITRGTINPIKFYSHDNLVNFLLGAGKKVEARFGDFKFYKA